MMFDSVLTLGDGLWTNLWFEGSAGTEVAREITWLYMWIWWFCVIWFVFLMGLTGFFVVKYRRRKGVPAPRSRAHNTPLEVAWTIIPTLFLIYIFFASFQRFVHAVVSEGGAEEISLVAAKWDWTLIYPNGMTSAEFKTLSVGGYKEFPIFVVPADYPVRLRMTSNDVIHSFWVPDFRMKFDVFPNRYTSYQFRADKLTDADLIDDKGRRYRDHTVYCAEYCGEFHSEMSATIRVMSIPDYKEWVKTGGVDLPELLAKDPAAAGAIVYKQKGCISCHSTDGTPGTGPTWQGGQSGGQAFGWGYDVPLEGGTTVKFDENYVRESLIDPGAKIHLGYPNKMVTYAGQISEDEIRGLIAYMQSVSDRGPTSLLDDE